MKFYNIALAKLNEKIQQYDLSFFEKYQPDKSNSWSINEEGHGGGYVPIVFSNGTGEIILEYGNMMNGARHFPKQDISKYSYNEKEDDPRDKKIWVICSIENKEALSNLYKEIQTRFNLTEKEIEEINDMTNTFIKESKKAFIEYSIQHNFIEKIKENFKIEDGTYEVGQGDSTVVKAFNNIFLYDSYHDCACRIIKDNDSYIVLMNVGLPINKNDQLELSIWDQIIEIKGEEIICDNLYFDKMNHLRYLIVSNEQLSKKDDRKTTMKF